MLIFGDRDLLTLTCLCDKVVVNRKAFPVNGGLIGVGNWSRGGEESMKIAVSELNINKFFYVVIKYVTIFFTSFLQIVF